MEGRPFGHEVDRSDPRRPAALCKIVFLLSNVYFCARPGRSKIFNPQEEPIHDQSSPINRGSFGATNTTIEIQHNKIHSSKHISSSLLKIVVIFASQLLNLVSYKTVLVDNEWKDEISVSNVNDVLSIIKSDYEKAYFVTGVFTSAIYTEDCTFEDPTIKFQGRELYARNLRLLLPFFDNPSIHLKEIEKENQAWFPIASWRLRTYLKLPWKPLISIDGRTIYDLDEEFRVVRHAESWNISALGAIVRYLHLLTKVIAGGIFSEYSDRCAPREGKTIVA
ncbi:hypothetical protein DH2020_023572 [Rehmannia glutinosa]|uniref:Uncharacterized protein n=1 Tax=Rehmannia glutinosa TaxID=99300 RepID=A0ABR0WAW8_REHGL